MKYPTISIEGSILSADILEKIEISDIPGQNPKDFGFDSNTKVKDEIAVAWADAQSYWRIFKRKTEKLKETDTGASETRQSWIIPFLGLLGFQIDKSNAEILNEKSYAISHRATNLDLFPVHIMGCNELLDKKPVTGLLRMSPHALVQEYLNLTEHLYAIVTNGYQLRILRDASRLVKLSYLEFNLEQMLEEDHYSDFALMYRLIHSSRMPRKMDEGAECLFEKYHQDALESGSRIREGLSQAVASSIKMFADGFMNYPKNQKLRDSIDEGKMTSAKLYQIMLRLIYRILFLTVIEERNLIYPKSHNKQKREIYFKYYSLTKLRNLCEKRFILDSHYNDLWLGLLQTFKLFEDEKFGKALDIKPLNGDLFGYNALDIINECYIDNKTLLECIRNLSLFTNKKGQLQRVNYSSLNVEEFGSVYEGLLEFSPQILKNGNYSFNFAKGDERGKTGSHYTPDELVKPLIKHSLEYLIEDKLDLAKRMANSEWQVIKKDNQTLLLIKKIFENEYLSRFRSLEKRDEYSRTDISAYKNVSKGGNVRNDISTKEGGSLDTGKSGRGLGQTENEGISTIHQNSEREFERIGNSLDISSESKSFINSANRSVNERNRDFEQTNAQFTKMSFSETEIANWWKNQSISTRYSLLATNYLLSLKVCDVACGSGHILLSAARRLAHEVAKVRTNEDQPAPDAFREAIRDVIRNCIYGVDKNPLAVELCKVSLWLEAHNPGEPLSFLDHKIKCGDSIVGLAHREELDKGIADEAFKRMPDDEPEIASLFSKQNKGEKKASSMGMVSLKFEKEATEHLSDRAKKMLEFIDMPEHTPQQITEKKRKFEELNADKDWWRLKTLADVQTAQFFIPKTKDNKDKLVTEAEYREFLSGEKQLLGIKTAKAVGVSQEKSFFHWFLEFPEVFQNGGFDCILGNPPFLGGKRISGTFGDQYLNFLKTNNQPDNGITDLVAYFFRRTFLIISSGSYQALISTNTIAQGGTRETALQEIINNNGKICFAIKSIRWPGIANVEVTLLALLKDKLPKKLVLNGKNVSLINSYLSEELESDPFKIMLNNEKSFIGSIILGDGFIVDTKFAEKSIIQTNLNKTVLFPYLIGSDLNSNPDQHPNRWVINFQEFTLEKAKGFKELFEIIEKNVKPQRDLVKRDSYRNNWWQYAERCSGLYQAIADKKRVLTVAQVSRTLAFAFVENNCVFSAKVVVFNYDKNFEFALLQSVFHSEWAWKYCTTMKSDLSYGPTTIFQTFPMPQNLRNEIEEKLEKIGEKYHEHRRQLMLKIKLGLTKTYNQFHNRELKVASSEWKEMDAKEFEKKNGKETLILWKHLNKTEDVCSFDEAVEGIFELRKLHKEMDLAVLEAYGWTDVDLAHDFYEVDYLPENDRIRYTISPTARKEILKRLLELNHEIHEQEVKAGLWDKKKTKKKKEKKDEETNGFFEE